MASKHPQGKKTPFVAICGRKRSAGVRCREITSLEVGQHRVCLVCGEAAALPNALGGQSPAPKFRAEARTHF